MYRDKFMLIGAASQTEYDINSSITNWHKCLIPFQPGTTGDSAILYSDQSNKYNIVSFLIFLIIKLIIILIINCKFGLIFRLFKFVWL